MIVTVICDVCKSAAASRVFFETKWASQAVCWDCHDEIEHDGNYDCKELWANIEDGLRGLVDANPGATTGQLVEWACKNVAVPVFLAPFDTAVRNALRNRDCFHAIKIEGSRSLTYEVIRDGDPHPDS